jgi:hypothetical protein
MPTPLMWGGSSPVLNYVPYLGPIASVLLLALGGLMAFADPWYALLPCADLRRHPPDRGQYRDSALVGRGSRSIRC